MCLSVAYSPKHTAPVIQPSSNRCSSAHVSPAESKDTVVFRRRILSTVGECVCLYKCLPKACVKCACSSVQPRRAWWILDKNSYDDYTSNIVIRKRGGEKKKVFIRTTNTRPECLGRAKQMGLLPVKTSFCGPTRTPRTACTRWNVL